MPEPAKLTSIEVKDVNVATMELTVVLSWYLDSDTLKIIQSILYVTPISDINQAIQSAEADFDITFH